MAKKAIKIVIATQGGVVIDIIRNVEEYDFDKQTAVNDLILRIKAAIQSVENNPDSY